MYVQQSFCLIPKLLDCEKVNTSLKSLSDLSAILNEMKILTRKYDKIVLKVKCVST